MATAVEELRERHREVSAQIREFTARYGDDNIPDAEAVARLEGMTNAQADISEALGRFEKFTQAGGTNHPPVPETKPGGNLTLGQRFVAFEGYGNAIKNYAPNGSIPDSGNFRTSPLRLDGGLGVFERNATLVTGGSDTAGGAFILADRQPGFMPLGRKPLRIRDVVTVRSTSSDLVEYVKQTLRTNNAATVLEAIATADGSGLKPESALAFAVAQAIVYTIANWMPLTKQAAADVPQLRSIIDAELTANVYEVLDQLMVSGTGVNQMLGMLNTSGRQTQAFDTNILTTTRKARTKVSTIGRSTPEAYLMNPSDWESIDLAQDNEARYYYGGPAAMGSPRLWGLPVVETEAIAAGTAITGQFSKCVLWDREQASLQISDSHADFFVRNLLALLVEIRAAFAVLQPTAIVEIHTV